MSQLFAALRRRQAFIFRWTLVSMPLLDELITGFPLVGLPLLRDQLGLSYEQIGLLFSISALSGMVTEPFINILSDHTSKRPWVIGGLLALAASFALAGSFRPDVSSRQRWYRPVRGDTHRYLASREYAGNDSLDIYG